MKYLLLVYILNFCIKTTYSYHPLEYCSQPGPIYDDMILIPQINTTNGAKLVQVNVLSNHGISFPLDHPFESIKKYLFFQNNLNENCTIREGFKVYHNGKAITPTFHREYDACEIEISFPNNCIRGDVTEATIEQLKGVGNSLYSAYFSPSSPLAFNEKDMNFLFFRALDNDRSRISGSIIIKSALKATSSYLINLHTLNKNAESMNGDFFQNCFAKQSAFKTFNSREFIALRQAHIKLRLEILKYSESLSDNFFLRDWYDTYISFLCGNYKSTLPPKFQLNDTSDTDSIGYKLTKAIETEEMFVNLYNNASYAKCVSQTFLSDFFLKLYSSTVDPAKQKSKFNLYSSRGFDIMTYLSALGFTQLDYIHLAGNFILEIYETDESKYYFRTLYMGKDVTEQFPGCSSDPTFISDRICPILHFKNQLSPLIATLPDNYNFTLGIIYFIRDFDWYSLIIGLIIGLTSCFLIFSTYKRCNPSRFRQLRLRSYRRF